MNYIESKKNQRVKEWKKLHAKKGRDRSGLFLIEGYHMVEEALESDMEIVEVIFQERADLPLEWDLDDIPLFAVTTSVLNEISETQTPQGIAAVCRKRDASLSMAPDGKYLCIDAVQDPGNIGTMIRTADAAGLSGVILGSGCADPYNSKVLRAAQGSSFHIPVIEDDLHDWVSRFQQQEIPVFGTALQEGKPYSDVTVSNQFALIVGNEGSGVEPALLEKADENLYIPVLGQAESLNVSVAAGILLYGLQIR